MTPSDDSAGLTITDVERFGKLLDDGLLLVGFDQTISYANSAASKMLGEELVNRQLSDVFPQVTFEDVLKNIGTIKRPHEFIYSHQKSITRQFRVKLTALSDTLVSVLLMDMTLQRNLDKVRRDFVANVSHELRSPLTSLIGFVETMRSDDEMPSDMRSHFLGIMDEEAKRMTRLIDDLISLSRVEVEEHIVPDEEVGVREVMMSVIEILKDRATRQEMTIQFHDGFAEDALVPRIKGDRDEIVEVMHNLIENAIKYGHPRSIIDIEMMPVEKGQVCCVVTNQGDGIEERHIPRLTERFYRVDKARSRQKGGTGLGLAIVKHIVNRHRGELSISSELGASTSFTVQFPLLKASAPSKRVEI